MLKVFFFDEPIQAVESYISAVEIDNIEWDEESLCVWYH